MTRPHGLLRAGYPYLRTLGMRRVTNFPADIAFSGTGNAYILMRSAGAATVRVWPLDDMDRLTDELIGFGAYGTEDGQLVWPVQIITDADGDIFISDEATHRISRFDQEHEFVSSWGVEGDSDGQMNGPTGIAFDPDGNLVVVDSKNNRVQRYTADGEYLGGFGSSGANPGEFDLPWGVHVDELGDIYVADWGNNRFQVFSADGDLKNVIGQAGSGDGEFNKPTGIAVDAHGDIYVADWGNDRVQMFNSEGQYIWSFRGEATLSKVAREYMLTNAVSNRLREMGKLEQEKYLRHPRSVRVDSEFRLFIPDYESYRVQIYQKDFVELNESQFAAPLRNPTLEVT
ncbi:MAG: NHL repeat-containing protein [SAR202 cluster bacterium]|nr:NHL repeat-containing protein [SAR202 cluster bacterium]MDP6713895.1 NHL repeat-containing protein [SAR202 cluster bacterium]